MVKTSIHKMSALIKGAHYFVQVGQCQNLTLFQHKLIVIFKNKNAWERNVLECYEQFDTTLQY